MYKTLRVFTSLFVAFCLTSCSTEQKKEKTIKDEAEFSYFDKNFVVVKLILNGSVEGNFILDTGIGITLISKAMCQKINCVVKGEHVGKRMSGQKVKLPMSTVDSIELNGKKESNFPVGILDVEALMPGSKIDGFLSIGFFKNFAHTILYKKNQIRFETDESLAKLRQNGAVVRVKSDRQGDSFGILMPLALPDKEIINVVVDTGSQSLILNERYMARLGISPSDASVKRKEGKDETAHTYVRYFTSLTGPIHLPGAEQIKMENPSVIFQKIIYDGLVGFYFLREFDVTYDLKNSQMIFNKPQ